MPLCKKNYGMSFDFLCISQKLWYEFRFFMHTVKSRSRELAYYKSLIVIFFVNFISLLRKTHSWEKNIQSLQIRKNEV